jgi:hypothetical protein
MRIVKQRLREMIPDVSVFLVRQPRSNPRPHGFHSALLADSWVRLPLAQDVDDLAEIGDLEGYIDRSEIILVYCSHGYFQSKNCMRELVASTRKLKTIIALVDPDASKGGLSLAQVYAQLLEVEGTFEKWGFDLDATLSGQALYDHIFALEPIEWNRIGHFQDVTMRLIAERLLPPAASEQTFVDRELVS